MFTVPTLGEVHRIFLPTVRQFFGDVEGVFWGWLEKRNELVFPEVGAVVFVRPASEPDSLRGTNLTVAGMDEVATEDQEESFRILQGSIRQTGFGVNQLWVTGTPKVRRRWIKQIWNDGVNPLSGKPLARREDYPIFRLRTVDNIHLPQDFKDSLLEDWGDSRLARQELFGEFIEVEGLAFPNLDAEAHLRYPGEDVEVVRKVFGLDMGGASPTAIVEWWLDRQGNKWAVAEFYKRNADEYDWVQWLADRGAKRVVCDPSASDLQIDHWRRQYGIYITRAAPPIKRFVGRVQAWGTGLSMVDSLGRAKPPQIRIAPSCVNLWDELVNAAFKKVKGRNDPEDAWEPGTADHAIDAGAYGLSDFENYYANIQPVNIQRVL
jgi:hypothetical protein